MIIYVNATYVTTFQESRWWGRSSRWGSPCRTQAPLPPRLGSHLEKLSQLIELLVFQAVAKQSAIFGYLKES